MFHATVVARVETTERQREFAREMRWPELPAASWQPVYRTNATTYAAAVKRCAAYIRERALEAYYEVEEVA